MAEPNIFEAADQFRAALLRRERAAATELVRAYGGVWQRIRGQLDALTEQIAQAQARGEAVSPAWLLQRERLQQLQRQVEAEIGEFARFAERTITAEQAAAVEAAQRDAADLLRAGLGLGTPPPLGGVTATFARLPAGAVTDLVGFLQDGSPLSELLDELGPDAGKALRAALITGLATGQNPRAIVRSVREALGGNLVRALTIARTETLRAYRESSRRTYEANRDVVEGWVWNSALGRRTCSFCWAMHGTVHRLGERMATHPRCRCAMVPRTKAWAALGFRGIPDARPPVERGADLFARLPDAEQLAVLGPAKLAAYRAGAITLEDLRGFRRDPKWGRVGYERSLADIVGREEARQWQRLAASGTGSGQPLPRPNAVQAVQRDLHRLRAILERELHLASRWNGTVHEKPADFDAYGSKEWNCSISLRLDVLSDQNGRWRTMIHELLHSFSPGVTPSAYRDNRGWEEGVVEQVQRLLRPGILAELGERVDTAAIAAIERHHSYNGYIDTLEILRTELGVEQRQFYLDVLQRPLGDRADFVRGLGLQRFTEPLAQQDWLSTFAAMHRRLQQRL